MAMRRYPLDNEYCILDYVEDNNVNDNDDVPRRRPSVRVSLDTAVHLFTMIFLAFVQSVLDGHDGHSTSLIPARACHVALV